MKETRKQKFARGTRSDESPKKRKWDILDRSLSLFGLKSLFSPLDWLSRADLIDLISPGLEVDISDDTQNDDEMKEIKAAYERAVETRLEFSCDGQMVEFSVDDVYRGLLAVPSLVGSLCTAAVERKRPVAQSVLAHLLEAKTHVDRFENEQLPTILARLGRQLSEIADRYLRIDEQVIWYKLERNQKYRDKVAFRVIVGRKRQLPVSLPVSEGRRKAFPCVRADMFMGPRDVMWNPARLEIGTDDRDLPVFVSDHAIARLHERIPIALDLPVLHRLMFDSLDRPRIHSDEETDGLLVEAGYPGRKVGYFVVELYADFFYVRTFLFLTMQGTPEAKCLRRKLGLSRRDIEHFKLDNFFTLVCSDLRDDPDLRRALAECGCDYILDFSDGEKRLSWLSRYRNPFRRELGLPPEPEIGEGQAPDPSEDTELQQMIDYSQKILKRSQGWTV